MYVVPDRFAFVCTPRTGSRTVSEVLMNRLNAQCVSGHHVEFKYLKKVRRMNPDLPVYGFTREPFGHLRSWFHLLYGKIEQPTKVNVPLRTQLLRGLSDPVDYSGYDHFQMTYENAFRFLFLGNDEQFKRQYELTGFRLNGYANCMDKVFLFEDGLEAFFEFIGLDVDLPHIGKSKTLLEDEQLSEATRAEVRQKYAADFDFYESIKKGAEAPPVVKVKCIFELA